MCKKSPGKVFKPLSGVFMANFRSCDLELVIFVEMGVLMSLFNFKRFGAKTYTFICDNRQRVLLN